MKSLMGLMLASAVVLASFTLPVAAGAGEEEDRRGEQVALKLAEARLALFAGEGERAVGLLTQAYALDGKDPDVLFELAHLALEGSVPADAPAVAAFLAAPGVSDDANLLAAYLHAKRGELGPAKARLAAIAAPDAEAEALRTRLAAAERTFAVSGHVGLAAVADSNVALIPDTATGLSGMRAALDGSVKADGSVGPLALQITAGLALGEHLNDRVNLASYDYAGATAAVTIGRSDEMLGWTLTARAETAFADNFADRFVTAAGLMGTFALAQQELLRPGLFVRAGYRSFGQLRGQSLAGRDGLAMAAGLQGGTLAGPVDLALRAGYQMQMASDDLYWERGLEAALDARFQQDALDVCVTLAYELRDYARREDGRSDQLLSPALIGHYALTDWLRLRASYLLDRNLSDERHSYTRHVGELGVEGVF